MPGISQQSIHRRLVLRPLILFPPTRSRFQFIEPGRQPDEIKIQPTPDDFR